MDTVCAYQLLYCSVLRKKGNRRNGLVRQYSFEVFRQREAGSFNFCSSILIALLGVLDKPLNSRLHRTKHEGRPTQTDHFKGADRLMQLLASYA